MKALKRLILAIAIVSTSNLFADELVISCERGNLEIYRIPDSSYPYYALIKNQPRQDILNQLQMPVRFYTNAGYEANFLKRELSWNMKDNKEKGVLTISHLRRNDFGGLAAGQFAGNFALKNEGLHFSSSVYHAFNSREVGSYEATNWYFKYCHYLASY